MKEWFDRETEMNQQWFGDKNDESFDLRLGNIDSHLIG